MQARVTVTMRRTVRPRVWSIRSRNSKSHVSGPPSRVRTKRYTGETRSSRVTATAGTSTTTGGRRARNILLRTDLEAVRIEEMAGGEVMADRPWGFPPLRSPPPLPRRSEGAKAGHGEGKDMGTQPLGRLLTRRR